MRIRSLATALSLPVLALVAYATKPAASPDFLATVPAQGCALLADQSRSTFVLYEVRSGRVLTCNASRAAQRFVPASTFKIAHTLLALEADAVSGNNELFSWDGRPRGVAVWDRDTTLAEAIPSSTVWVFQEIANRLDHKREDDGVRRLQYGNQNVGRPADLLHFWLSGPLEISANEQVAFLAKLRAGLLDGHKRDQKRTVALLRLADCGQGCTIHGKTGAVLPIDDAGFLRTEDRTMVPVGAERTGWFVGWVDKSDSEGGPVVFAHNLDLSISDAMDLRTAVAYKILVANGILKKAP